MRTEIARRLPRRALPVAMLAWFGVDSDHQGRGSGGRLLAQALRDCHDAGQTFAFVAVVLDCVDVASKAFCQQYDFTELPGHPYRLFLSFRQLEARMTEEKWLLSLRPNVFARDLLCTVGEFSRKAGWWHLTSSCGNRGRAAWTSLA